MTSIKIAVQKSGRLHDGSIALLKECGISIDNGKNQLKAAARNFPLEVLYLRNSDIPQYLADGVAHLGIIGDNLIAESQQQVAVLQRLGFSRCRLSLAVPKNTAYEGLRWFEGKRIATSYPRSLQRFLDEQGIRAAIHEISGSVEIAPSIGLADGICDLVSSGNTLFTNGLEEVQVLFRSEAVLAACPSLPADLQPLVDKLLFRISAVLAAKNNRYILLNAPNERVADIAAILPGMRSPTVVPLLEPGWSSLHSVIGEDDFWDIIDQLKAAGAQGILVTDIAKMVR